MARCPQCHSNNADYQFSLFCQSCDPDGYADDTEIVLDEAAEEKGSETFKPHHQSQNHHDDYHYDSLRDDFGLEMAGEF